MPRFGPVLTAMVTPMDGDGNVDFDGVGTLAKWLVERGNDGLVVTGTTGEASFQVPTSAGGLGWLPGAEIDGCVKTRQIRPWSIGSPSCVSDAVSLTAALFASRC